MERNEFLGNAALYGGSLTACGSAPAYLYSESTMLMLFSALGALAAISGLVYTVWNGNRNYRLAREQFEFQAKLRGGISHGTTESR